MTLRSPDSIRQLFLEKRGILPETQDSFVDPNFFRDTYSPWLMKGMEAAVVRIIQAIEGKQKITIFGDYDADGVPATALLIRGFRRLGKEVEGIIPTRASGYGLTMEAVEVCKAKKIDLLITVDNGTVAQAEVAALAEAGIDVIVCDHHQPQEGHLADQALAILNPKQSDCQYPFKELCGCALAWKLLLALYERLEADGAQLRWNLDLVALSIIADMVPLVGENRVLARYGLMVLRKTRTLGLKALAEMAGVKLEDISAGSVSFRLAPRINAPSRMHKEALSDGGNAALQLLITDDAAEAYRLAGFLQEQNTQRQGLLDQHLEEARLMAADFKDRMAIVVYKAEWSTGVIGLMAGRLLEHYQRPVVVLAQEGGIIKGSARSVDGIDAVQMITAADSLLERYGGHSKAAGLTFEQTESSEKTVDRFRTQIEEWLQGQGMGIESMALAQGRAADLEIFPEEISLELAVKLQELEPFGIGFPAPLFTMIAEVRGVRMVGAAQNHLSCMLVEGLTQKKAIAFNYNGPLIEEGKKYRLYFSINVEEWRQVESAVCQVRRIEVLES